MDPREAFDLMVSEGDMVLHKLDACVATCPTKTFIYYGEENQKISFAEFQKRSNTLATALANLGVGADDRVSVFMRNSLAAAYAMFAVWRAGAVYAPVNFNFKGQLLKYQLHDTQPKVLIVDANLTAVLEEVLNDIQVEHIIICRPSPGEHDYQGVQLGAVYGPHRTHEFWAMLEGDGVPPRVQRRYDDIANIVYTSGTTGPSKGVLQSFRWINQYCFLPRQFITNDDVLYCDLPLYHVAGAFYLIARAVWCGSTVGLWDRFSPSEFWQRVDACGATQCVLLDVMVPWLMNASPRANDRNNTLHQVHMQPLPQNHHEVAQRFGFDFITVGYGQTESGSGFFAVIDEFPVGRGTPEMYYHGISREQLLVQAERFGAPVLDGRKPIKKGLMGKPAPLKQPVILDDEDNECLPGVVGQLAFRPRFPSGILKGYLNKPEKTLEAFRNLWFHTGDGCYRDEYDIYYFVDRMVGFLRVRGENVSSYEVESLVASHPKVNLVAAVPVPAHEGDEEDIAVFVQPVQGQQLSENELLVHCRREMPKYMVPRYVRIIDSLPLTPTGKIEKYKLRQQIVP